MPITSLRPYNIIVEPPEGAIFLALTYDEEDYYGTMTWTHTGTSAPHVTPNGFSANGHNATIYSTTIPTWMQSAASTLYLQATLTIPPYQTTTNSHFAVWIGASPTAASSNSKLALVIADDQYSGSTYTYGNYNMNGVWLQESTSGGSEVRRELARTTWRYEFRMPEFTRGGNTIIYRSVYRLDEDTCLVVGAYNLPATDGIVYKINYTITPIPTIQDYFTFGTDVQLNIIGYDSQGRMWFIDWTNKQLFTIDLDASFAAGTPVIDNIVDASAITAHGGCFVSFGSPETEYIALIEYVASGTGYIYLFDTAYLTSGSPVVLDIADRYKRLVIHPTCYDMMIDPNGTAWTVSDDRPGVTDNAGKLMMYRDFISTAIAATDGDTLAADYHHGMAAGLYIRGLTYDAIDNRMFSTTGGLTSMTDTYYGWKAAWSRSLDVEYKAAATNTYQIMFDESSADELTCYVNNYLHGTYNLTTATVPVTTVVIGGSRQTATNFTSQFAHGLIKNVLIMETMPSEEVRTLAMNGAYETRTLTEYSLPFINMSAEDAYGAEWVVETGNFSRILNSPPGVDGTGSYIFYAGATSASQAYQRLAVASTTIPTSKIDAGEVWLHCEYWEVNPDGQTDTGYLGIRTRDTEQSLITQTNDLLVTVPERLSWWWRSHDVVLDVDTRYIDAVLYFKRNYGTSNDAYFDDIVITAYSK